MGFVIFLFNRIFVLYNNKKVTASEILKINGFYLLFRILMQIPAVTITDFLGRRKSIILGNIFLIFYVLILIIFPGAISIVIANLIFSLGYNIKTLVAGYLFVINNYIPMFICLGFVVISTILSFGFKDINESFYIISNSIL